MKKNHFFALMFAVVTMAVMVGCEKEPLPDEPDVDASLPKVLLAGNDLVGTQATGAVCWEDGNKSSLSTSVDDYATGVFRLWKRHLLCRTERRQTCCLEEWSCTVPLTKPWLCQRHICKQRKGVHRRKNQQCSHIVGRRHSAIA